MIFHENRLPADISHEISYLIFSKIENDVAKFVVRCSCDWRFKAGIFFAILGRGPRAFQIGKISAVNHYFGKFSKQTRTAFLVSLKTKLAITHTIAIKLKENRMQF